MGTPSRPTSAKPGPCPGTEPLNPVNLRRLMLVSLRHIDAAPVVLLVGAAALTTAAIVGIGLLFGSSPDLGSALVVGLVMLAANLAMIPLGIRWSLRRWRRDGWVVGYFDDTGTLLVHRDPGGAWMLSDHHAFTTGHHHAEAFRRRVFAHLAAEADRFGAVIVTDTRVPKLAQLYTEAMPGLTLAAGVQRDVLGRRLIGLRRQPASPASREGSARDTT